MKTLIWAVSLFLLAILYSSFADAQSVKGNGNVVKKQHFPGSFDKIELGGIYNTVLKQGNSESVVIETDENLQPYLRPEVSGNTLRIVQTEGVRIEQPKKIRIHITVKELKELASEGVGNISTEGAIRMGSFTLNCKGVGNVEMDLYASEFYLKMTSVGIVDLSGEVKDATMIISGVGNVEADDLKIENLTISSSGVGNADVYVTGEIHPTLKGAGNINCKGKPAVKDLKQDGAGRFRLD
jgi:hypothetical protein